MINQKDFTYGFELEGIFTSEIVEKLRAEMRKIPLAVHSISLKTDGSVNRSPLIETARAEEYHTFAETDSGSISSEINIGVFNSVTDMLSIMKLFKNGINYWSDSRCGLHIHIKPKRKLFLKGLIFDSKFINSLYKKAEMELCFEIRTDRMSNSYCNRAKTFKKKLRDYKSREKYSFMGNHYSGTTEFRFFSACQHKVENAKQFFEHFFSEINKIKLKSKNISLAESVLIDKPEQFTVTGGNQKINESLEIIKTNNILQICV